jgi:hypothetical protein
VILDKDLRERHGGSWEGLNDAEIRERYPAEHATWMPPDGEPTAAVADGVAAALRRTTTAVAEQVADPDGLAVVVSHGAALRLGTSRLLGMLEELFGVLGRWPTARGRCSASGTAVAAAGAQRRHPPGTGLSTTGDTGCVQGQPPGLPGVGVGDVREVGVSSVADTSAVTGFNSRRGSTRKFSIFPNDPVIPASRPELHARVSAAACSSCRETCGDG